MAKIAAPKHIPAGVDPSAKSDGAGPAPLIVDDAGPDAEIAKRATAQEVLDGLGEGLAEVTIMHAEIELLSREAATAGDNAMHGKLSRIANVVAEFRNGLIAAIAD